MSTPLTGEAAVKRSVCDLLSLYRILHWRMNAGDRYGEHNGKKWRIAGHEAGTADILAAPILRYTSTPVFMWIECKRPKGGFQSEAQKAFQWTVERQGHIYLLATSVDDVLAALKRNGCAIDSSQ